MRKKKVTARVVLEGTKEYLENAQAICETSERARKIVAQLNEALKELAELRKQVLL